MIKKNTFSEVLNQDLYDEFIASCKDSSTQGYAQESKEFLDSIVFDKANHRVSEDFKW